MFSDEEVNIKENIYSIEGADQSLDDDILSATEAGFMQGYVDAYEEG